MGEYWIPSKKSKYYLPKETYLTAVHFARQYPLWVQELNTIPDTGSAVQYDKDKVQTSNVYDANAELAMRRYEISKKKELIDQVALEAGKDLHEWLILSVCYGLYYHQLQERGMPCSRNTYTSMRQLFYNRLSQLI